MSVELFTESDGRSLPIVAVCGVPLGTSNIIYEAAAADARSQTMSITR